MLFTPHNIAMTALWKSGFRGNMKVSLKEIEEFLETIDSGIGIDIMTHGQHNFVKINDK